MERIGCSSPSWRVTGPSRPLDPAPAGGGARKLGPDDLVANGVANQCRRRMELQFSINSRPMRFNRLDTDAEDGADLLIAVTFGDESYHGAFTRRQRRLGAFGQERLEQRLGDHSGKERLVLGDG